MTGLNRNIDRNRHRRTLAQVSAISLSIRVVQPVLAYLTSRGLDSSAFLETQGVDPAIFRDPEARLPHAVAICLWEGASRLTNDLDLGLHVAEGIRPGSYGALDYAVRTSATMGEGLRRTEDYRSLRLDVP